MKPREIELAVKKKLLDFDNTNFSLYETRDFVDECSGYIDLLYLHSVPRYSLPSRRAPGLCLPTLLA